jgi:ELWxxDGT repeat protein
MKKKPFLAAALLSAGCLLSAPLAAEPRLVRDFHQGSADEASGFGHGLVWKGLFYHAASDPAHGGELWRTDGTPGRGERLTDLCPGPCSAGAFPIAVFRDHLYLLANDGASGYELWRTDGVPGHEERVRDLCPGPCGSEIQPPVEMAGQLFFIAGHGSGQALWRTDGTRRGTVHVADLCTEGTCAWSGLQRLGSLLIFTVVDPTGQRIDLWRSDGTAAGTGPLPDPPSGPLPSIQAGPGPVAGGLITFWADDALWRTDGTPEGTIRLREYAELTTRPNPGYSQWPGSAAAWKGEVYWTLSDGELVRSDGTREGTVRIADINYSAPHLLPLDDEILLVSDVEPQDELWRTRGTPETTEKVVPDLGGPGNAWITELTPLGDDRAVFFIGGRDGSEDWEVWVTDATAAGTHRVEGAPPPRDVYGLLIPAGDQAFYQTGTYFLAEDLWRTDGTGAGTWKVRGLRDGPGSGGPLAQAVLGGELIFSARTGSATAPLFVSDGTPEGTRLLSRRAQWAAPLIRVGEKVYFPTLAGRGFWSTDGTPAGTRNLSPQAFGFSAPSILGDALLFGAVRETSPHGYVDVELFRTDGGRPRLVRNIDPFAIETLHHICVGEDSQLGSGVAVGNRLLFGARDGLNGRELWSTDGTRAGTRLVRDINPATPPGPPDNECGDYESRDHTGLGSDPQALVAFRNGALFTADDGETGRELWWSDGTAAGTRRVADLRPGAAGAEPHDLTVFRGAVYFFAAVEGVGEALWRTDGTEEGTELVHPLSIRGLPSWGRSLTVAGGRLYFSAYNESTGAELWSSRGTAATTGLVLDLNRGPAGSAPQFLTAVGAHLVFSATDGQHGLEPWRTDGTAAGTRLLGDIAPGRDASAPGPFSLVGGALLTGADDGVHGRELWAIGDENP